MEAHHHVQQQLPDTSNQLLHPSTIQLQVVGQSAHVLLPQNYSVLCACICCLVCRRLDTKPQEIQWSQVEKEAETGKTFVSPHPDKNGQPVVVMRPRCVSTGYDRYSLLILVQEVVHGLGASSCSCSRIPASCELTKLTDSIDSSHISCWIFVLSHDSSCGIQVLKLLFDGYIAARCQTTGCREVLPVPMMLSCYKDILGALVAPSQMKVCMYCYSCCRHQNTRDEKAQVQFLIYCLEHASRLADEQSELLKWFLSSTAG